MRFDVHFFSRLFKPHGSGQQRFHRSGQELAHWLSARLMEEGIGVAAVETGDWGWLVITLQAPFPLTVSCGNADDKHQWTCIIEGKPTIVQRMLHKLDPEPEVLRVRDAVATILATVEEITEVEWQEKTDHPGGSGA